MQKHGKNIDPVSWESKIVLSKRDIQRFWGFVDKGPHPKGCWLWVGYKGGNGYGRFTITGFSVPVHRISFILHKGPIVEGMLILHSCDNPVCVFPDHLRMGTNADNSRDMVERGRSAKGKRHGSYLYPGIYAGSLNGRAILTEKDVAWIRAQPRFYGYLKKLETEFPFVSRVTLEKILTGETWRHVK